MISLPVTNNRRCGDCTACCRSLGVEELGKPYFAKCEHQCKSGCRVYGTRPSSCRTFACQWLDGLLPEDFRPDKLGLISYVDQHGLQVVECQDAAFEHNESAAATFKLLAARLDLNLYVVTFNRRPGVAFRIDRRKYAADSEAQTAKWVQTEPGGPFFHAENFRDTPFERRANDETTINS